MPIFTINGSSCDTLDAAFDLCRGIWAEAKAPAVAEQIARELSQPTAVDIARVLAGLEVPAAVAARIEGMGGAQALADRNAQSAAAAAALREAEAAAAEGAGEVTP